MIFLSGMAGWQRLDGALIAKFCHLPPGNNGRARLSNAKTTRHRSIQWFFPALPGALTTARSL